MADSEALLGYQTKFAISTDNGSTWDEIAEVFDVTPPSSTIETVDVTHMQSPDGNREFIPGLTDPGECSFELNFIPGSDADVLLRQVRDARARVECRVTFPNGAVWTFTGLLTSYAPNAPTADKMTASVSFKVSGSTVVTAESAPTNVVLPAISGLLDEDDVLTAYEGEWTGSPSFSYQWKNAGVNISGATSRTYTIQASDAGDAITVTVTGTNSAGSAAATSAPVVAAA